VRVWEVVSVAQLLCQALGLSATSIQIWSQADDPTQAEKLSITVKQLVVNCPDWAGVLRGMTQKGWVF
jgi:hypothetical protein